MRSKVAVAIVLAGLALTAPAEAAPLTATAIRVAPHPGLVRVVVDFAGGRVIPGEVVASDPNPFRDGIVRLPLSHRRVRTLAAPVQAEGVTARVRQRSGRIVIRLQGAARRFKYVGYQALRGPERLAIDLYESTPPEPAAEIRRAPGGCLSLRRFERAATAARRRWSTSFRYPRTRRRTGTLEAVALSAKDGTLDCLTQVRVRFGGR
jgi:hypothetical protein